jgi:RNA-dependent RNA polymerase
LDVKCPWEEFDREEEALRKSPYGGLGFDENKEFLGWHGGQVLFHGKGHNLSVRKSCTPEYKLTLEPAELSSSHSFGRRFGSKHFLRMKLTKNVVNKHSKRLLEYLHKPLILCGSVFQAFFAKESNVFYVKTNEGTDGENPCHHRSMGRYPEGHFVRALGKVESKEAEQESLLLEFEQY